MRDYGREAASGLRSIAAARAALAAWTLLGCSAGAAWAGEARTPRSAITQHAAEINGVRMSYTAAIEDNLVSDSHGHPGASIITVAYTRDGVADPGSINTAGYHA